MNANTAENRAERKKRDVLAEHILRAAGLSSDDLMSFQHVFRDTAANLRSRLTLYTSAELWTDVHKLDTLKTSELAASLGSDTLVVRFRADRWGGDVLFILEPDLVSLATDVFFGSAEPQFINRNGRPFSQIEIRVGEKMALSLAEAMNDIFSTGEGNLFDLRDTMPVQQFDCEGFARSRMFSCTLQVCHGKMAAHLRILMPRSCHRPIQEAVTRMLCKPSNYSDPLWARRLRQEVSRAHISLEAFITQGQMTLKSLSQLHVGQILPLPAAVTSQIRLRSGKKTLYKCTLGKTKTNFSVRINDPVDEEEEMIDELVHR